MLFFPSNKQISEKPGNTFFLLVTEDFTTTARILVAEHSTSSYLFYFVPQLSKDCCIGEIFSECNNGHLQKI